MKLSKKLIITGILGTIVVCHPNIKFITSVANIQNINTNSTEKLADILSEEVTMLKKVEFNASGNPISVENIHLDSRSITLPDGIYTLDFGDGWIKGRDAGVIGTMIVPSGTSGFFMREHTESFSNTISFSTSASFTKSFVTATIKVGYGHTWTNGVTTTIHKIIKSPENKNLFTKVHSVFRRIDVINVKNGVIIDRAETYKPSSYAFKSLEYSEGERVNQALLYEKVTNCILGDSSYDIQNVIDTTAIYEGYAHVKDQQVDYWSTKYYEGNSTIGIYFTVPKDGKYEIKEMLLPESVYASAHVGLQKQLYKVDSTNESKIELINETRSNLKMYHRKDATTYPGNSVVANLKAGEKYLIVFNGDKALYKNLHLKHSLRMRIKKL